MKLTIRLRDKVIIRYGRVLEVLVNRAHRRLLERIKKRFALEAALGDEDLVTPDEVEALREYLQDTVKVSYRLGRAQAEAEGYDPRDTALRHQPQLNALTDEQMDYSRRLVDDQEQKANEIIRQVLDEQGPDAQEMTRRLEEGLGTWQGRARAIAVTETANMYGNSYCDTLEDNGIHMVIWRAEPDACEDCKALDGRVMTIGEFRRIFPKHPNCRCWPEAYLE